MISDDTNLRVIQPDGLFCSSKAPFGIVYQSNGELWYEDCHSPYDEDPDIIGGTHRSLGHVESDVVDIVTNATDVVYATENQVHSLFGTTHFSSRRYHFPIRTICEYNGKIVAGGQFGIVDVHKNRVLLPPETMVSHKLLEVECLRTNVHGHLYALVRRDSNFQRRSGLEFNVLSLVDKADALTFCEGIPLTYDSFPQDVGTRRMDVFRGRFQNYQHTLWSNVLVAVASQLYVNDHLVRTGQEHTVRIIIERSQRRSKSDASVDLFESKTEKLEVLVGGEDWVRNLRALELLSEDFDEDGNCTLHAAYALPGIYGQVWIAVHEDAFVVNSSYQRIDVTALKPVFEQTLHDALVKRGKRNGKIRALGV